MKAQCLRCEGLMHVRGLMRDVGGSITLRSIRTHASGTHLACKEEPHLRCKRAHACEELNAIMGICASEGHSFFVREENKCTM
jgi:hypothetical protein